MNLLISIFLIIISVATFFFVIDPMYNGGGEDPGVKQLLKVKEEFDRQEANTARVNQLKRDLRSDFQLISSSDLQRIKKLLPDHMDNVKLIVDIQRIGYGSRNNIRLGDISLSRDSDGSSREGEIRVVEDKGYESVVLNFSFTSNYASFKRFLEDLHRSLRLVDIVSINIREENEGRSVDGQLLNSIDNYNFSVSLRTYWMSDSNI